MGKGSAMKMLISVILVFVSNSFSSASGKIIKPMSEMNCFSFEGCTDSSIYRRIAEKDSSRGVGWLDSICCDFSRAKTESPKFTPWFWSKLLGYCSQRKANIPDFLWSGLFDYRMLEWSFHDSLWSWGMGWEVIRLRNPEYFFQIRLSLPKELMVWKSSLKCSVDTGWQCKLFKEAADSLVRWYPIPSKHSGKSIDEGFYGTRLYLHKSEGYYRLNGENPEDGVEYGRIRIGDLVASERKHQYFVNMCSGCLQKGLDCKSIPKVALEMRESTLRLRLLSDVELGLIFHDKSFIQNLNLKILDVDTISLGRVYGAVQIYGMIDSSLLADLARNSFDSKSTVAMDNWEQNGRLSVPVFLVVKYFLDKSRDDWHSAIIKFSELGELKEGEKKSCLDRQASFDEMVACISGLRKFDQPSVLPKKAINRKK